MNNSIINEGGDGFDPNAARDAERAAAKVEARMADLIARKDEVRATWNEAVAAHTKGGKVAASDLPKIERMAGVTQIEIGLLRKYF